MAILDSNSLYFPNISLFSDRKEGTLSDKSLEEVYKTHLLDVENTPIKQDERFREMEGFITDAAEQYYTEQEAE